MNMKPRSAAKKFVFMLSTALLLLAAVSWVAAQTSAETGRKDQSDIEKRINSAATVLTEVMGEKDKAVPDKIMRDAKCVAVVPSMVKIAVGFGGNHGKGVATCRTETGWSAPAPFSITGGSWGLQIGGQAVDLVMLVMNQKGMDDLLSSKFKIGAGASAAVGSVGREASGNTDFKLTTGMMVDCR